MAQQDPNPVPQGMSTLTPHFWFNGNCKQAIEFYKKAFKAELVGQVMPTPDGNGVWHAMLKIGNSNLMMADVQPGAWEKGPETCTTMSSWLYVENCDTFFDTAVTNGCEVTMPMMDAFWGDRFGQLKDAFGHCWTVATRKWIYTPEEMQQKQEEMMAQMAH